MSRGTGFFKRERGKYGVPLRGQVVCTARNLNRGAPGSASALRPPSVRIWPTTPNADVKTEKLIYPTITKDFTMANQVVPANGTLKAEDGVEFHIQLFLPRDLKPGAKRPAIVFVHGGPARQMLLGYHYLSFYHVFYSVKQWLADQGYIPGRELAERGAPTYA